LLFSLKKGEMVMSVVAESSSVAPRPIQTQNTLPRLGEMQSHAFNMKFTGVVLYVSLFVSAVAYSILQDLGIIVLTPPLVAIVSLGILALSIAIAIFIRCYQNQEGKISKIFEEEFSKHPQHNKLNDLKDQFKKLCREATENNKKEIVQLEKQISDLTQAINDDISKMHYYLP
jgi:hypothetical protein